MTPGLHPWFLSVNSAAGQHLEPGHCNLKVLMLMNRLILHVWPLDP